MTVKVKNHQASQTQRVPQLILQRVDVHYGPHCALQSIDLAVQSGERIAFVGANGSGKSTLLRVMHGEIGRAHV